MAPFMNLCLLSWKTSGHSLLQGQKTTSTLNLRYLSSQSHCEVRNYLNSITTESETTYWRWLKSLQQTGHSSQGLYLHCLRAQRPSVAGHLTLPPKKPCPLFVNCWNNSSCTNCIVVSYFGIMGLMLVWHLPTSNKHLTFEIRLDKIGQIFWLTASL